MLASRLLEVAIRTLPFLLFLVACGGSTIRLHESVSLDTETTDDGTAVGAFEVVATLGPVARDFDAELLLRSKGFVSDGSSIELSGLVGLTQVGSDTSGDIAEFTFAPDFAGCTEAGYAETASGGCEVTVVGLVVSNTVIAVNGASTLKADAPEEWAGDEDTLEYSLEVRAIPWE